MTPASALLTLAAVGFAGHAIHRGDRLALAIAAFCGAVYAVVFLAGRAMHRRARSSEQFRLKFVRPAELRIERVRRRAS